MLVADTSTALMIASVFDVLTRVSTLCAACVPWDVVVRLFSWSVSTSCSCE